MRFDLAIEPGGYAWWYLDAISEDGSHALTLIAFIGSVFSPYYAWSGRHAPRNHCALNVALYRPRASRWAMTERPRRKVDIGADRFQIGPSALSWDGEKLIIDVKERGAPIPYPLRGRITVRPSMLRQILYPIDEGGLHRWRPMDPGAHIELDFAEPALNWSGRGYLDFNQGDEPLEDGFSFWDWSRVELPGGESAVLYNTAPRSGGARSLALHFDGNGDAEAFEPPPQTRFPTTPIWRIPRPARAEAGAAPRIVRTLEDTPFYSRSVAEYPLFGAPRRAMHESLSGDRLRRAIVQAMLPFRMPRY